MIKLLIPAVGNVDNDNDNYTGKYYIGSVVDDDDDNNIQFDILKGHIGTVYDENYYDGEDEQDHETSYTLQIHLLKHFNFVF